MTASKKHDIEDPLERAATMGVIGSQTKQPSVERPGKQVKHQGVQASKRLEVTSTVPSPHVPVDEVRKKQTVYLSASLLKWAKHRAVDEDMEISEVVEEALRTYREQIEGRQ